MTIFASILFTSTILMSCKEGPTKEGPTIEGPTVGSIYWSPYHKDGNSNWVGPVVYYLYSKEKCYVRASGINNRYGGERIGRIESWEINDMGIKIENHQFDILGYQVLKSNDRVFFKANTLSEAYSLIYSQTNTSD